MKEKTVALAGNPNVGKSTVFNALTGMRQHTGNWPGKTVTNAVGHTTYKNVTFELVDLPGAYSLDSSSPDEKVTGSYIRSKKADIVLIVADATCLMRNLILVRDILDITSDAVLCVNLMDEAEKRGIRVDVEKLSRLLGIPVVAAAARSGEGMKDILETLYSATLRESRPHRRVSLPSAEDIYSHCVSLTKNEPHSFDRKLDRIVTSRSLGFPIMFLLLLLIFWLTMAGANYPSAALSSLFSFLGEHIREVLDELSVPAVLISVLMDGLYTTLTWVISVMLPPMAIFFPLFTLLEDFGYLPRIAFNLDHAFRCCGAHGKQSLTMCMGFGCNACGVTGCRIIESPRERLIAVLTNSFVPCNGRFPALIAIILIFFVPGASYMSSLAAGAILAFFIVFSIFITLIISRILSATVLKGVPSSFVLELPPYRKPKIISIIVRSMLDRTVFVLGRAVMISAPFGVVIWLLANIETGDMSLLDRCTEALDPFGRLIGVDGVIVMAFILGFPANEIVIPVMLMCYMSAGTLTDYSGLAELHEILSSCGWSLQTAMSVVILCLFHFPCGTTCLTVKKETGSLKWTALAFFLPTVTGVSICFIMNMLWMLLS
ncbi:MAG: ferrous iron transporter B [Anaerovoracaceae bacterium]|nr:ferrous iron transporter B [Anaerovoracaceae bacterium]